MCLPARADVRCECVHIIQCSCACIPVCYAYCTEFMCLYTRVLCYTIFMCLYSRVLCISANMLWQPRTHLFLLFFLLLRERAILCKRKRMRGAVFIRSTLNKRSKQQDIQVTCTLKVYYLLNIPRCACRYFS